MLYSKQKHHCRSHCPTLYLAYNSNAEGYNLLNVAYTVYYRDIHKTAEYGCFPILEHALFFFGTNETGGVQYALLVTFASHANVLLLLL